MRVVPLPVFGFLTANTNHYGVVEFVATTQEEVETARRQLEKSATDVFLRGQFTSWPLRNDADGSEVGDVVPGGIKGYRFDVAYNPSTKPLELTSALTKTFGKKIIIEA